MYEAFAMAFGVVAGVLAAVIIVGFIIKVCHAILVALAGK